MENKELDWDMMSDYYTDEGNNQSNVRSFEEIANETAKTTDSTYSLDEKLVQTIADVKRVREASVKGATVEEIVRNLEMDKEYVTIILMTLEGYAEDSDTAIAHLVMLG